MSIIIFLYDTKTKQKYPLEYILRKENYISLLKKVLINEWKLNDSPLSIDLEYEHENLDNLQEVPKDTSKHNCIIVKYKEKIEDEKMENVETWLFQFDAYFNNVCDRLRYCLLQVRSEDETGTGTLVSKNGKFVTNFHVIIGRGKNKIKLEKAHPIATWKGNQYRIKILNVLEDYDLVLCKLLHLEEETPFVRMNARTAKEGTTVVAGAMPDPANPEAMFSKGILSFTKNTFHFTDATMEPGWSGGAVMSIDHNLYGIVRGGATDENKIVRFVPTMYIYLFPELVPHDNNNE